MLDWKISAFQKDLASGLFSNIDFSILKLVTNLWQFSKESIFLILPKNVKWNNNNNENKDILFLFLCRVCVTVYI